MKKQSISQRLLSSIAVDSITGCWIWMKCTRGPDPSHQYGQILIDRKTRYAHQVSYEVFIGTVPKGTGYHGACVLHRCDNSRCINPSHLFIGTHADNMADMARKNRLNPNHGIWNRGSRHGMSKLDEPTVLEIRRLAASMKQVTICNRFGISPATASQIIRRRRWTHI